MSNQLRLSSVKRIYIQICSFCVSLCRVREPSAGSCNDLEKGELDQDIVNILTQAGIPIDTLLADLVAGIEGERGLFRLT